MPAHPLGSIAHNTAWFQPFAPVISRPSSNESSLQSFQTVTQITVHSNQFIQKCVFNYMDATCLSCGVTTPTITTTTTTTTPPPSESSPLVATTLSLSPDSYIKTVYFRQCSQLCGTLYPMLSAGAGSCDKNWQETHGYSVRENECNFVYSAKEGCQIVGYEVSSEGGPNERPGNSCMCVSELLTDFGYFIFCISPNYGHVL